VSEPSADSARLTDPRPGRAAARRLSFRTSVRVMKTLAWASFLTFAIPAAGNPAATWWLSPGRSRSGRAHSRGCDQIVQRPACHVVVSAPGCDCGDHPKREAKMAGAGGRRDHGTRRWPGWLGPPGAQARRQRAVGWLATRRWQVSSSGLYVMVALCNSCCHAAAADRARSGPVAGRRDIGRRRPDYGPYCRAGRRDKLNYVVVVKQIDGIERV